MYYLIFSYYEDTSKTSKISNVFFESDNYCVSLKMIEFFEYIQYKQFGSHKSNDNYRKLSSIFYIDICESSTIKKQLNDLRNLIDNPNIDINTRNEVKHFLKFLKRIIVLLGGINTYSCNLEIFSVEGNLPID